MATMMRPNCLTAPSLMEQSDDSGLAVMTSTPGAQDIARPTPRPTVVGVSGPCGGLSVPRAPRALETCRRL